MGKCRKKNWPEKRGAATNRSKDDEIISFFSERDMHACMHGYEWMDVWVLVYIFVFMYVFMNVCVFVSKSV